MILPSEHGGGTLVLLELLDIHRIQVLAPEYNRADLAALAAHHQAAGAGVYWCTRVLITDDHVLYYTANGVAIANSDTVIWPARDPQSPPPRPDRAGDEALAYVQFTISATQQVLARAALTRSGLARMRAGIDDYLAATPGPRS